MLLQRGTGALSVRIYYRHNPIYLLPPLSAMEKYAGKTLFEGKKPCDVRLLASNNVCERKRRNDGKSPLEKRITKIKEEKDQELMLVSLQLEKQRLEICNESILNKESKHLLSVAILRKSEVYEKFHDRDAGKIISEDWELLEVL